MATPQRRCLACGRLADRAELWRIVRCWPDHTVRLDQGMGRSAYLCPKPACLKIAQQKKRLGRSLRCSVPADVFTALNARLSPKDNSSPPAPMETE